MTSVTCGITFTVLFCAFQVLVVNCENPKHELESVTCGCDRVSNLNVSEVKVYFYNFDSDCKESWAYIDEAADCVFATDFRENQCFNIFILGYNTDIESSIADDVKCSFSHIRCNGMKSYGIIIDHSAYTKTKTLNKVEAYKKAVKFAKSIGHSVGRFIAKLLTEVDIDNLNVIGHSLGAHIAGYAAEKVGEEAVPLPVLYTADAAGPCFNDCPEEHVRANQADIVINIHCTNSFGTKQRTGDYDFYAHDGVTQKCCHDSIDLYQLLDCSHDKCALIALAPSFRDDIYEATYCNSYGDYISGSCDDCDTVRAGFTVVLDHCSRRGSYYFEPESDLCCE